MPDPASILPAPAPAPLAAPAFAAAAGPAVSASFGDALALKIGNDPATMPASGAAVPVLAQSGQALPLAGNPLPAPAALAVLAAPIAVVKPAVARDQAKVDETRPATDPAPDAARDPALAALALGLNVSLAPVPAAPADPAAPTRVAGRTAAPAPLLAPGAQTGKPEQPTQATTPAQAEAPMKGSVAAVSPGTVRFVAAPGDTAATGRQGTSQDHPGGDPPAAAPAQALPLPTPAAALALAPAPSPGDGTATAVAATPAPALQAHDMAALVDRLVEARNAAQSGDLAATVRTTIRHGDFGPVALHFETGANGLSVTASSPDPGFASAAQSALAVAPTRESAGSGLSGERPGSQTQAQAGPGGGGPFSGNGQPGGSPRGDAGLARNAGVMPASTTPREGANDGAIFA